MQKLHLFSRWGISALPDFDQSLSIAGLIYSVLLLTIHAVAAVWLPKSRHHQSQALDYFGAIAQKERKMGVLRCSTISISALYC